MTKPPAGGKTLGLGFPGNVSRSKDAIIHQRPVQSTDSNAISFGSPVALNPDNSVSLWGVADSTYTTLTTALTSGNAYTSLAVAALPDAVPSGASVVLTSGANTQTYTLSAAAAVGATTLSVTSLTANFAYPVGTTVAVGVGSNNTIAQLVGIAVREVKQAVDYFPASGSQLTQYLPGQPCDVLERGSCTVYCQLGTPYAGGPVYLRTSTNASYPNAVVGGWEAQSDSGHNLLVPQAMWTTGNLDSSSMAELTLLTRNLP